MPTSRPSRQSTPTTAYSSDAQTSNNIPNHPAYNLLARAHSPESAVRLFHDKIRTKPLLLQPTDQIPSACQQDKRALRRHVRERKKKYHRAKQRPRPLSAKEKREKGLYDLPGVGRKRGNNSTGDTNRPSCRYETYRGLHRLWTGYVLEILGYVKESEDGKTLVPVEEKVGRGVSATAQGSVLASMDFHGMEVEIVRCRDVGRVGLKGIVVRETKYSFVLVCPGDKVRMVMKGGAIFKVELELPNLTGETEQQRGEESNDKKRKLIFELHGDQLEIRPVERAVKKFKWKTMDYL